MTRAIIDLVFTPNVDLVPTIRRFAADFCEQTLSDRLLASKVGLATHELADNAVRHAIGGNSRMTLEAGDAYATGNSYARVVRIRTQNRASAIDTDRVGRAIAAMDAATDPATYYQELIRRSVKNPIGSGLGLGRIFAEADMLLSATTEGDLLVLQACLR